jgi:hypothetical protein
VRRAVIEIPLFGSIPAGFGADREQEADECTLVSVDSIGFKPTRNAFALRVTGESIRRASMPRVTVHLDGDACEAARSALGRVDTGNLHGVVEFVQAAQAAGIKPIIGAEVRVGSHPTLLYAENATGYFNLCSVLSRHAEGAENEDSVAAKQ